MRLAVAHYTGLRQIMNRFRLVGIGIEGRAATPRGSCLPDRMASTAVNSLQRGKKMKQEKLQHVQG